MTEKVDTRDTLGDVDAWTGETNLQEGTRIDRYQILGLIGRGGMGAVYKAYDPELDRSIAIKILTVRPKQGETDSRPQVRLMREAQALAKVSHPNVVAVHDVGTHQEGVYIAMEYVKGKTLREWLRQAQRSQKEILRVLLQAGQGLQAAHTQGIIHRDFKPDNVIIGDDGQVKVLDFGLARAAGSEEVTILREDPTLDQESISGERLLSTPLTRVGAMVGTVAYMAPEHFEFAELDEKTDQFSFCVTLFEALYGKRPFCGKTTQALEKKIVAGWIEIPQEASVPPWIEEIVTKGLSVSKQDRHASMLELLAVLENDPEIVRAQSRKKLLLMMCFLLSALFFLGAGYLLFKGSNELCTGARAKVAEIWNDDNNHQIRLSFTKTGLSYANDTYRRVVSGLENYLEKWNKEYTQVCEATRMRGEQSEEVMDLKMGCLDKKLMQVAALSRIFRDADKTIVGKAIQAISSLSGFANCNDVKTLRSKTPPPKDKQTRIKVAAMRDKLAEVEALCKTGKYRLGLELANKLEKETKTLGYRLVRAEVLFRQGDLLDRTGEYKKAEAALRNAARLAGECSDGLLAAQAVTMLVWIVGVSQVRYDDALLIAQDAEVILGLGGGDESVRARFFNNLGVVFNNQGDYQNALLNHRKALAIRQKTLGLEHPVVATSLNNMGVVLRKQGQYDKALRCYRKVRVIWEKSLGAEHPDLAQVFTNAGVVFAYLGQQKKELEYHRKALSIIRNTLGPEHPNVAMALNNIGRSLREQGQCHTAVGYFRRAQQIYEKVLGPEYPHIVWSLSGLGQGLICLGDYQNALRPLQRVVNLCATKSCNREPHGRGLFALARVLFATGGDKTRVIKLVKKARAIMVKTPKAYAKELKELDAILEKCEKGAGQGLSVAKQK